MNDEKKRLRWFQFSLRNFLILVILVCVTATLARGPYELYKISNEPILWRNVKDASWNDFEKDITDSQARGKSILIHICWDSTLTDRAALRRMDIPEVRQAIFLGDFEPTLVTCSPRKYPCQLAIKYGIKSTPATIVIKKGQSPFTLEGVDTLNNDLLLGALK